MSTTSSPVPSLYIYIFFFVGSRQSSYNDCISRTRIPRIFNKEWKFRPYSSLDCFINFLLNRIISSAPLGPKTPAPASTPTLTPAPAPPLPLTRKQKEKY